MIEAPLSATQHPGQRPGGAHLANFPHIKAEEFGNAMRNLASGVAIVTTRTGEARRGLTASSVTSLCMEPPCVLASVNPKSETHESILSSGYFGISLLKNGQEALALSGGTSHATLCISEDR